MNWKCVLKNAATLFAIVSMFVIYVCIAAYMSNMEILFVKIIGWSLIGILIIAIFIVAGIGICLQETKDK